jgi:hypothetical protein
LGIYIIFKLSNNLELQPAEEERKKRRKEKEEEEGGKGREREREQRATDVKCWYFSFMRKMNCVLSSLQIEERERGIKKTKKN